MGHKDSCEDIIEKLCLLNDTEPVPQELKKHLDECPSCRKEFEAQKKMRVMLRNAAPDVPKLSDAVMTRIREEKLEIKKDDARKRMRLPLGTIAAAAAVLAVYVSVYYSKLPLSVFRNGTDSTNIEMSDNAPMLFSKSMDNSEFEAAGEDSDLLSDSIEFYDEPDAANGIDVTESKANGTSDFDAQGETAENDDFMPRFSLSHEDSSDSSDTSGSSNSSDGGANTVTEYGNETAESNSQSDGFADGLCGIGKADVPYCNENGEKNEAVSNDENQALSGSGGSGGGGSSSYAENKADNGVLAEMRFETLSEQYPDRIDRATFERVGNACYLAFTESISDFETEYTADNLMSFAEQFETN